MSGRAPGSEWCALLDQDDLFADHALATVAREIENLSLNLPGFELAVPPRLPELAVAGETSFAFAQRQASVVSAR